MNETQKELRARFATIFSTVWATLDPETRKDALMEIDRVMSQDATVDWVGGKLRQFPTFPANKGAMEREMMEMLTVFRYPLDAEDIPTLEEAMANPWEFLVPIMEGLANEMDQSSIE